MDVDGFGRVVMPFIDMCNEGDENCTFRIVDDKYVQIVSKEAMKSGEIMLIDYGEREVSKILRTFGFVARGR